MDEILIEEKKYISSKRAAKLTGYAKDYIGQLCREGRVPARLVGRSWYVLEAAIQDHRFGDTIESPAPVLLKGVGLTERDKLSLSSEFPRYETSVEKEIPFIDRLRNTEAEVSQHLQESWQAWFDRVEDMGTYKSIMDTGPVAPIAQPSQQEKDEEKPEIKHDSRDINVPIHAIYKPPPKDLLPHIHPKIQSSNESKEQSTQQDVRKGKLIIMSALQVVGILFATIAVATAVIGSGYFDTYITSLAQVRIISGVTIYNK